MLASESTLPISIPYLLFQKILPRFSGKQKIFSRIFYRIFFGQEKHEQFDAFKLDSFCDNYRLFRIKAL